MNKRRKVALIILLILALQFIVSVMQLSRYHYNADTPNNNYACVEMSRNAEKFFESHCLHVLVAVGYRYNYDNLSSTTSRDLRYGSISGMLPRIETSHMWLIIDFDGFYVPFESTALIAFFDPTFWLDYDDVAISEGFYAGDTFLGDYLNFEWRPFT